MAFFFFSASPVICWSRTNTAHERTPLRKLSFFFLAAPADRCSLFAAGDENGWSVGSGGLFRPGRGLSKVSLIHDALASQRPGVRSLSSVAKKGVFSYSRVVCTREENVSSGRFSSDDHGMEHVAFFLQGVVTERLFAFDRNMLQTRAKIKASQVMTDICRHQ